MWNIHEGVDAPLTPARIKDLNKRVLAGQAIGDDVHSGEVRTHSVAVMNYRGARAEDCDYLLSRLCNWLTQDFATTDPAYKFSGVADRGDERVTAAGSSSSEKCS